MAAPMFSAQYSLDIFARVRDQGEQIVERAQYVLERQPAHANIMDQVYVVQDYNGAFLYYKIAIDIMAIVHGRGNPYTRVRALLSYILGETVTIDSTGLRRIVTQAIALHNTSPGNERLFVKTNKRSQKRANVRKNVQVFINIFVS